MCEAVYWAIWSYENWIYDVNFIKPIPNQEHQPDETHNIRTLDLKGALHFTDEDI